MAVQLRDTRMSTIGQLYSYEYAVFKLQGLENASFSCFLLKFELLHLLPELLEN